MAPNKSPAAPGKNNKGEKAAIVVNVAESIGFAVSFAPRYAACNLSFPALRCSCTASTTTMALSTSKPKAIIKAVVDI